jgi:hypothetical protein
VQEDAGRRSFNTRTTASGADSRITTDGRSLNTRTGGAAPAKRSGEESGNGRRGEPSLLRKHFLPFFSLRGKENEAQLFRLS